MNVTEKIPAKIPIRLLMVDDHPVVRAGLNSMLRKQSSLKVVGSVHGGREALEFLATDTADVMLLDLRMPNMDGIDTLRALRKLPAPPRVVILSNFEYDEEIYRAVEAGAMGYLLKDTSRDEIIAAIKAVHAGNTHFPGTYRSPPLGAHAAPWVECARSADIGIALQGSHQQGHWPCSRYQQVYCAQPREPNTGESWKSATAPRRPRSRSSKASFRFLTDLLQTAWGPRRRDDRAPGSPAKAEDRTCLLAFFALGIIRMHDAGEPFG
jgi:CheY-like chemotaxis protein